uniref:Replication protein A 70 kDa DNA-binding subunit B/D first OB fold domain-containing protein n=1 Tax=Brassica oleracea var. oleracea TaxID=109376 RepID=A0A0D3D386_BRAOL
MSSSDAVGFHQPLDHSTFPALQHGRSSQSILGRLLRFWDSPNINNPSELTGITLLFLDEKDSMINGFIPADQAVHFRGSLQEGNIYKVADFEVQKCPHTYKITDQTYVICFTAQTTIDPVINNVPVINHQKFMVREYAHLQILANTNLELPDVVGQIQSVKGYELNNTEVVSPILIGFLIAPLSGAGGEHFNWLDDNATISNKQLCSVGDLNMFLSSTTTQEASFICKARIVEVLTQNGWNYLSCVHCSKEIEKSGATLHCNRCFNSNITGVVRYRVELLVDDGNNYAIVVVLNKEMLKLTKQDAANLLLNEVISKPQTLIKTVAITQISIQLQVNSGVNGKLPKCIEELEGQTFIFHIRVSPSNSASSRCPFTVSAISGQITTEDFNNYETPDTVRKFGEASTSDSASNTSTVEVEQGGRKDALE